MVLLIKGQLLQMRFENRKGKLAVRERIFRFCGWLGGE